VSSEWSMPRRGESCTACRRPFEPGERLRAYLYETGDGYERRDYCPSCQPDSAPAPLASWTTRRRPAHTTKTRATDWAAVFRLFERLADAASDRQRQLRFLLALVLWRRKALRLETTMTADGQELWLFSEPHCGGEHRVCRPELDEARLEQLSQQLEEVLSGMGEGSELLDIGLREEADDA